MLLRWGQKTEMSVALIWNAIYLILVSGLVLLLPTGLRENAGLAELRHRLVERRAPCSSWARCS